MVNFPEITSQKESDEEGKIEDEEEDEKWYNLELNFGYVSSKDLLFFTKNLSVMLKAGSTLSEALEVIQKEVSGRLKQIVKEIHQEVMQGFELSQALEDYPRVFSSTYISILRVGEKTGSLGENLEYLVDQLEKNQSLKKKVLGAMFYPAVVLLGGIAVALGIVIFVLPKITTIFKNFEVELPWTTQLLIKISDLFQTHGLIIGVSSLIVIVFLMWFLRRDFVKPVTHWILLKTPVVKKMSKHFNLTMFFRTLSILLKSGVTIDEGLKICRKTVTNIKYRNFINNAYEDIKSGESLTSVMEDRPDLFPPTNVQIISVGEDSGTLSDALEYCSTIHEEELDDLTKNLSDILEPILLIVIGVMVGFIALSIITPIYSITGQIR